MVLISIERVRCVLPAPGRDVPSPGTRSLGIRGTLIALAVVWGTSAVVAVPTAVHFDVGLADHTDSSNHTLIVCHSTWNTLPRTIYSLLVVVVSYVLPQVVLSVNYTAVWLPISGVNVVPSMQPELSRSRAMLGAELGDKRLHIHIEKYSEDHQDAGYWRLHIHVEKYSEDHQDAGYCGCSVSTSRSTVRTIKMLATVAVLFLVAWAPYFTIMTIEVIRIFSRLHSIC